MDSADISAQRIFIGCSMCPPGPKGVQGPDGELGTPGPKGPRGIQGSPGRNGTTGLPGEIGLPGNPGRNGRPGPVGHYGLNGTSSYSVPGLKGKRGQPGQTGEWGEDGLDNNEIGEIGPDGPRGQPGYSGPTGQDGKRGPLGPSGLKGASGKRYVDEMSAQISEQSVPTISPNKDGKKEESVEEKENEEEEYYSDSEEETESDIDSSVNRTPATQNIRETALLTTESNQANQVIRQEHSPPWKYIQLLANKPTSDYYSKKGRVLIEIVAEKPDGS
uniref:Collagen triple helix repeat protein n=1 Tax=Angiostrongylus cantonensis TaxID=6313 RepID=A0A0K0DC74_ANGCA